MSAAEHIMKKPSVTNPLSTMEPSLVPSVINSVWEALGTQKLRGYQNHPRCRFSALLNSGAKQERQLGQGVNRAAIDLLSKMRKTSAVWEGLRGKSSVVPTSIVLFLGEDHNNHY